MKAWIRQRGNAWVCCWKDVAGKQRQKSCGEGDAGYKVALKIQAKVHESLTFAAMPRILAMDGRAIDLPGKTPWPSNPQIGDSARVYFLEAIGLDKIKIGASEDVADRCRVIQGLSPVPLSLLCHVPGGEQLERSLHERFSHLRSHGEWFYATPELREFIKALAASQKTA